MSVKNGDHSRRTTVRIYFTADVLIFFQDPQNAAADDVVLRVLGCRWFHIFAKLKSVNIKLS